MFLAKLSVYKKIIILKIKKKIIYITSNIQHLFNKIIYLCYIIHTNYADPK